MAAVGDNLWDRVVCWLKLGIVSAYDNQGYCTLMKTVGASTYFGYIWSGIGLVGTDHGTRAGAAAAGTNN